MSARILIADGDAERGRRVADACRTRGLDCCITTHGAAALETALQESPLVLVAQLDLPLIDGPQLAAILHSNPRTQSMNVVFLADRRVDAERHKGGGEVVPPPIDPEGVAARLHELVVRRGGAAARRPVAPDEGGVEGQLSQVPIEDLLQLFHVSRNTGVVELERRGARRRREVGQIFLRGGDVIQARVGQTDGVKALFRLLAWDRGGFKFEPRPVDLAPAIQTPTRTLLREGRRQLDEWERLSVDLPPLDAQVKLVVARSALPNVIHPLTQEVLLVLELHSRVRDVVERCSFPDYQVLRTLHTLVARGLVELRREPSAVEDRTEAGLFSPAQAARLREWLSGARPRGGGAREAKLLVLASDLEATRDLVRLLERIPDADLDARASAGAFDEDDLLSLGRLRVDGDLGIELVHVPASPAQAALWPLAGHGALGILLLLSGSVSEAVAALRRPADVLRSLPRARLFHLLLMNHGARVTPESLRDNLSLLDEGSLFLVPLDNREKAGVLLREAFGQILP